MTITINSLVAKKLKLNKIGINDLKELAIKHFGETSDKSCMIYDAAIDVLYKKMLPVDFINFTKTLHANPSLNVQSVSQFPEFFRGQAV